MATASVQAELVDAASHASAPVGVGRRFSFIGLNPRVGTSTVAALTGRALARGRSGRTLLADAALDSARTTDVPDGIADGVPKKLRERLRYREGVFALTLAAPATDAAGWSSASGTIEGPGAVEWRTQVGPAARYFDIVCTDWESGADLSEILDRSQTGQAVCIVAPFARTGAEYAVGLARALHDRPNTPAVMVAFVDAARTGSTWPRLVADRLPFPTVAFGYDGGLAAGGSPGARSVHAATLAAATLMRASDPAGGAR